MKTSNILITHPSEGYELLDSGEGEKLERFGTVILSRPDPQALWKKLLPASEWKKAHGQFGRNGAVMAGNEERGSWTLHRDVPVKWEIIFGGLKLWIKPTAFKHTGLFPEQVMNWNWMRGKIEARLKENNPPPRKLGTPFKKGESRTMISVKNLDTEIPLFKGGADQREVGDYGGDGDIEVLNLFGYTGGASLACAQAGAKVVHIDSSKAAVNWARENAEISGLKDKPIRWIIEDARLFVEREIKRGRKYDAILMDPPAFGHGPTSELWKIENNFLELIENCMQLLSDKPLFFLINGYSAGYSAIAYENNLLELKQKYGGSIEIGELAVEEKENKRLLPSGIFARWSTE